MSSYPVGDTMALKDTILDSPVSSGLRHRAVGVRGISEGTCRRRRDHERDALFVEVKLCCALSLLPRMNPMRGSTMFRRRPLDARGIKKIREITIAEQREIATLEAECTKLLVEIEASKGDALAKLRQTTGKSITAEQLEGQLLERLEKLVDAAVARALQKREVL